MSKYLWGFLLVMITFWSCKSQMAIKPVKDSSNLTDTNYVYPLYEVTSNLEVTKADSSDLANYWREVVANYMHDDTIKHLSDKELIKLFSINYDDKLRINSGSVFYAPDKKFKILTITGESCGAYCNSFWNSKIITVKGKRTKEFDIRQVQQIFRLPDGKYLVLEVSGSRPASVYTVSTNSATIIGFEKDSIYRYPFEYTYPIYDNYKDSLKLTFSQEHYLFTEQYLKYDPKTKKLSYQYANNFSICCEIDSSYLFKGEFQYEKGEFKLLYEKKQTYVEPEQK